MANDKPEKRKRPVIFFTFVVLVSILVAVGAMMLLINILERKQEAKNPFYRVVELDDNTVDPETWGKNFPLQYDDYSKTVDQVRTRYGGSEAFPRTPTAADPRSIVAQSRLEEDPRLKTMWAGYAFSRDFREERGHAYMLADQTYTERQQVQQPGTCLHCHASVFVPYRNLGNGDLMAGFNKMNQMTFAEARKLVTHPVSCIDCHDPESMQLRVTRPGFIEGIKHVKEAQGAKEYNVNLMATRQEMRTYVCAQCHVEYYFKGKEKTLVYPWQKGLKVDDILAYYDEVGHKDWNHADTGAPVLKAQHPEFELWNQGVHARSGVSCADCHMPYKREGAHKVSDHHVRSPLLNINRACQTCHNWPENELRERVFANQGRTHNMRNLAMDALVEFITDVKTVGTNNIPADQLKQVYDFQRKAQFYLDFIEAENSMGFHAPQEAVRILGESINFSRKGQNALRTLPKPGAAATATSAGNPQSSSKLAATGK